MLQKKETIAVIVPVYNEESCLDEMLRRLLQLKERMNCVDMEIIFVNDGSSDESGQKLNDYAMQHSFVKVINFTRNFGHQIAITAGIDVTQSDYAVFIDADLQDPPEFIEDMYRKAKEGFDVVYARRLSRKRENVFKRLTAAIFYRLINLLIDIKIPLDVGDFRLISGNVLKTLKAMRENHRFVRGLIPWTGFGSAIIYYHRDIRYAGHTKFTLTKMINFALDAIFSFSNMPIRFVAYLGMVLVGVGMMGAIFLLYLKIFTPFTVPGITTVIVTIIIVGGFQIIMLGILGEYIGRIFEESKRRPLYVVKDMRNIPLA